jgi:protein AroM
MVMTKKRVAFITVGQSPRVDIMPEMLAEIGDRIEPVEFGLLDGLSKAEIAALEPTGEDYRIVSRLKDGSEAILPKAWVEARFQEMIDRIDGLGFDLIVLLCTGSFPSLCSRTLMVEAGRVIDHVVDALAMAGRTIGVMLPNPAQVGAWERSSEGRNPIIATHASPYTDRRFAAAAAELKGSDFVVMHCMGYNQAMRREVAEVYQRPVLLSRGAVAAVIRQLI